jgi:hypothetical protein
VPGIDQYKKVQQVFPLPDIVFNHFDPLFPFPLSHFGIAITRKIHQVPGIDLAGLFVQILNGEMVDQETAPEDTVDDDAIGVMVPPLQQKIELIKKSEGVKSVYDTQEDDELATLKKHAGLNTAVIADEDEPFEG